MVDDVKFMCLQTFMGDGIPFMSGQSRFMCASLTYMSGGATFMGGQPKVMSAPPAFMGDGVPLKCGRHGFMSERTTVMDDGWNSIYERSIQGYGRSHYF